MNLKKLLKGVVAVLIFVWISLLIVISEDIYDRRPVISLFKMLQSDGSTEIVDFEVMLFLVLGTPPLYRTGNHLKKI